MSFPNVKPGAERISLHVKPVDNYVYFKGTTNFSTTPLSDDLWEGVGAVWFSPTQICLTLIPSPVTGGNNKLTVRVTGVDQFGFPASEVMTLTSVGVVPLGGSTVTSRQGSKRCYCSITAIQVVAVEGIDEHMRYRIGIGRTKKDVQDPPPLPFNSYRIPIQKRLRERVELNLVQNIFRTHEDDKLWFEHIVSDLDLGSSTVQIILNDKKEKHFAVVSGIRRVLENQI